MKSLRLLKAASYTKGFNCLADCGTDHGKLPIYCVANSYVKKAYASDNKEGPIQNATNNIEEANLNGFVIPILADGLTYLDSEVDVVSILGMGGRLIKSILENADLRAVKRLIIIANSENVILRDYLQIDWEIKFEELIKERNKYYQLMVLEPGSMQLTEVEKEFGPLIIKERAPEFVEMINKNLKKLYKAFNQANSAESKVTIDQRIKLLQEVIS